MTQLPPPGVTPINYGRPDGPRPANALAITSLVCGILGCFVVTPFVAIVTGILGLGRARLQGGRGLAVTGIILGSLWIVGGVGAGGVTYFAVKKGMDIAKTMTVDTVNALVDGDVTKAQKFTSIPEADLRALSERVKSYGHCKGVSISGFNSKKNIGQPSFLVISGQATFEQAGVKTFSTTVSADGTGSNMPLVIRQLDVE